MGDEGDKGAGDPRLEYLQQYTLKTTKQVSPAGNIDQLLTTKSLLSSQMEISPTLLQYTFIHLVSLGLKDLGYNHSF